MEQPYLLIENLVKHIDIPQTDTIVSRTVYKDERLKAILFGFAVGQELSDHTTSQTAIIQILAGEATVMVNQQQYELSQGGWVLMQPHCPHSIYAKTPVTMLLLMMGVS